MMSVSQTLWLVECHKDVPEFNSHNHHRNHFPKNRHFLGNPYMLQLKTFHSSSDQELLGFTGKIYLKNPNIYIYINLGSLVAMSLALLLWTL